MFRRPPPAPISRQNSRCTLTKSRATRCCPTRTLTGILAKYTGTNTGVAEILKAGSELQAGVSRPRLSDGQRDHPAAADHQWHRQRSEFLKDGWRASVVTNNHYFSSEQCHARSCRVCRPTRCSSGRCFRANWIAPTRIRTGRSIRRSRRGPEENTSALVLNVKDRLPLHGKVEFNNQNSPGTPDLRINTSAAYNNLWQLEHSLGVQYSFSPASNTRPATNGTSTTGRWWRTTARFYRLPLGDPEPVATCATTTPDGFRLR